MLIAQLVHDFRNKVEQRRLVEQRSAVISALGLVTSHCCDKT